MSTPTLLSRIHGCIAALAIGDAYGIIGQWSMAANKAMWGQPPADFTAPKPAPEDPTVHADMKRGEITDDTMAMLALATGETLAEMEPLRAPVFSRPTPFTVGDAAVIDDDGRILLIRRADNGRWAMPGGALEVGSTVQLAYVDQSRDSLDANKTVWEEISDGNDNIKLGKVEMQSRAYVSGFNFRGPDQQKKVGDLSGGERNRVHLAKMLKKEANVILLDEPTNDLDTETLATLEEALESFAGCAVIISHDRWFLDRLATHILAFEGDSQVVWFEGNYADYEADYKRRRGQDADTPHRIRYKPLRRAS